MRNILAIAFTILFSFVSCTKDDIYLHYALNAAGDNKSELKAVIKHYRNEDKNPLKLKAAKYLIANMPAHFSYADTIMANRYYADVLPILKSGRDAVWQRDTIVKISRECYPKLAENIVSDIKIMTADYLIYSIDHAFTQWRTRPWAKHLTYDEFCDWLLPYKVAELQKFDHWRDTLSAYFCDSISHLPLNKYQCHTIYGAIEIVRNEFANKIKPNVIWDTYNGHSLLSAETMVNISFGSCLDYVTIANAVFRSLGLPSNIDNVPVWGRHNQGHFWYIFLSDNGIVTPTEEDVVSPAGRGFFPYQRFPKVYRFSYQINRDVIRYLSTTQYHHPFVICRQDVTNHYGRTTDVQIISNVNKLKDKNVYIATVTNDNGPHWFILDYGILKHGKVTFKNMGSNSLYITLGYNGKTLVPISDPFIIAKDGSVHYIHYDETTTPTKNMNIRRKYYESYNVVEQHRKILGGYFQCADHADFSDAVTLYTIETTELPNRIELNASRPYRYWRYKSPNGSWGNIADLAFYGIDGIKIEGRGIANIEAGQDAIERAYDGNLLSNFEINQPDGNWVGVDFGHPTIVGSVSLYPRSDDNDVCPGNDYELLYFDGHSWQSLGYQQAQGNTLYYCNVPQNTLLWLRNYTKGRDERPFVVDESGEIMWW